MALSTGTHLGPYEIIAPLGAGGMGEVYKARDGRLDRIVAIKVLLAHVATDPARRERFEREARVVSQLSHPHICTLFDVGRENGTDYLVIEYLEGQTLGDRLLKGPLTIEQALHYAVQIVDALETAHRKGIIHRDLKPANVMLTKGGAKLLDFGIARMMVTAPDAVAGVTSAPALGTVTAEGTLLGTVQYMAPEQLDGRGADARSDLFALGTLLYEMLTGQRAFAGPHQSQVIAAVLDSEPPPISATQPGIPPALDHLVHTCLAKNPDERWQNAGDVKRQLQWIAAGGPSATNAAVSPRQQRRGPLWWLAAAVVVVGVALAVGFAVLRDAAPEVRVRRLDLTTPPTQDPFSFALSPDGRQIAFVAMADAGPKLWLRSLDQTDAQPLADTDGASHPFWAPDSRSIAFFADGKLKRLDLNGGKPAPLADADVGAGGTWSRDGVILFSRSGSAAAAAAPNYTSSLMRVAAGGGAATEVTRRRPGLGPSVWPEFLPDGRHFLYLAADEREGLGVYLASLDSPDFSRLLDAESAAVYAPPGHLLLVRQGALVAIPFDVNRGTLDGAPVPVAHTVGSGSFHGAFSSSASGLLAYRAGTENRRELVWIDRGGRVTGTVGPPDDRESVMDLAPDGQRAAVTRRDRGNQNIWLIDVVRGVQNRFTDHPSINAFPLWSRDGNRVMFSSTRSGPFDLFEKPASGVGDERLHLASPQRKAAVDWSPDGHILLYVDRDPKMGPDLWALSDVEGARKPFPVVQTRFDEDQGQFSPDGHWIAYRSNESGQPEIYVQPFPGPGSRQQVSNAGGNQPRWRRDGTELFYVASDRKLVAVPIGLGAEGPTLKVGAPTSLFRTRLGDEVQPRAQYAVARDGQRFLMNVVVDEGSATPITIVENWTTEIRK